METATSASESISLDEFADLYQRHGRVFRSIAASVAGLTEADDIVQKAAQQAIGRLGQYRRGSDFRAWFGAFVRNEARNHARSDHRRQKLLRLAWHRSQHRPRSSDGAPGDGPAHSRLFDAIRELPEDHAECLMLRVFGECSFSQIAAITQATESTCRSHVHRARAKLADLLRDSSDHAHLGSGDRR